MYFYFWYCTVARWLSFYLVVIAVVLPVFAFLVFNLRIVKHVVLMSCVFFLGWGSIFLLVAIDYKGQITLLVDTLLQLWAVFASLMCMANLFLYNHEVRQFLKNEISCRS
jgi:hypothetical protein